MIVAAKKGRNIVLFFLLSILFWPAAMILSILSEDYTERVSAAVRRREAPRVPCPQCGESIAKTAKVCRFCKLKLSEWVEEIGPAAAALALKRELKPQLKPRTIQRKPEARHSSLSNNAMVLIAVVAILGGIVLVYYWKQSHNAETLAQQQAQQQRETERLMHYADQLDQDRRADVNRALNQAQRDYENQQRRQQEALDRERTRMQIEQNQSERGY